MNVPFNYANPRGWNNRLVDAFFATQLGVVFDQPVTCNCLASLWGILSDQQVTGWGIHPNLPITLPRGTYDFILISQLAMLPALPNASLLIEVADPEVVAALGYSQPI